MSVDFATLQGLTIPEGVVTQIADAAGNVLWSSWKTSGNVILEVEKITSDTYAGSTTYTGEEFILLDIYPKSGGTVNVTYGGLTKTFTDDGTSEEPNAQQVFFGTFNGVSDSVATPSSGTLTIEGDYAAFGTASFTKAKSSTDYFSGIKKVTDFGVVEIIPANAFRNCTALPSVLIPNSITSISEYAFYGCSSLTSVVIPDSVTTIGDHVFSYCTALTSVIIPNTVTSICDSTFYTCTSLTSVVIPDSVTSIGEWAFGFCRNLASIRIPNRVTSIGGHAFQQCLILASIRIPAGVTSIGDSAFSYCANLTDIVVDPANETYTAENGVLFTKDKKTIVAYPSVTGDYTIPNFVTIIGAYAFFGAKELTGIIIPDTVTSIGGTAFRDCTALPSVIIPNSVTSIGDRAFYGCNSLTSVVIPDTVTSIGDYAFQLASGNSRTVNMLSTTPAALGGKYVFDVVGTNNIIVPVGSGEAYRTAEKWSRYADYITEG